MLDDNAYEVLRSMLGAGADFFIDDLLATYLDETPQLIQRLHRGQQTANAADVRMVAHSMKSSSANLGAKAFSQLCDQIEEQARVGTLTLDLISQVDAEYALVAEAMIALRAELV